MRKGKRWFAHKDNKSRQRLFCFAKRKNLHRVCRHGSGWGVDPGFEGDLVKQFQEVAFYVVFALHDPHVFAGTVGVSVCGCVDV
jgi:hypothetical protein